MNKDFKINDTLITACNYNEKGYYEFYDIHSRIVATITSDKLKLPNDNEKAWEIIANIFGDSEDNKMTIKELKDWVSRQREVLKSADDDWFADIDETKEDWLEQELITLFEMIEKLEDK